MKMKPIFLLLTLLSIFGITASAQSLRIDGRQWKLVELNGSPVGASNAYLQFDGGQTRFSGMQVVTECLASSKFADDRSSFRI
jgi:heat shock protein HslJ